MHKDLGPCGSILCGQSLLIAAIPAEINITILGTAESASELYDRLHSVVVLRISIVRDRRGKQVETKSGDPEMEIRCPPSDYVPSPADQSDPSDVRSHAFSLRVFHMLLITFFYQIKTERKDA